MTQPEVMRILMKEYDKNYPLATTFARSNFEFEKRHAVEELLLQGFTICGPGGEK